MDGNITTKNMGDMGRLHWYHWLVVIASLTLTLCAWYITTVQARQKTQVQFNFQANQIQQLVEERMGKYADALRAGVAVIHSQGGNISVNSWKIFSSSLSIEDQYPGINGIGVIKYIAPSELENFIANEKKIRPYFNIYPPHEKNEYWPIVYIEPETINKKAVGLDMAHEHNRFTAAKKARDTGTTQITGPITLVQDAKKTPGFLFYAPFYKQIDPPADLQQRQQQFVGIVYAPFIMEKLMEGTLLNQNRLVHFSISDGDNLLYDELHIGSESYDMNPLFSTLVSMKMYGQMWEFNIQATELFRQQYKNNQPLMILFGGIIIDAMLLGLFIILTRSNKKAVSLAKIMTDEFKKSEERLNVTINSMMDGLLTVDDKSCILSINRTAEIMFGVTSKEVVNRHFNLLMASPYNIEINEYMNYQHAEEHSTVIDTGREIIGLRKDGNTFPMELAIGEMNVDDNRMFTCVVRDISERKAVERVKSEFISTVSHELRTPLTSIRGSLGLILGKPIYELPDKMRKMLDVAYRNSEQLTLLINDILDLENLELGRRNFKFSLLDIVGLAKHAVENNIEFAKKNKVNLYLKTSLKSAYVYGDESRLLQVFANLISNAIKFSDNNGEVEISIVHQHPYWRVGVRDFGPGIEETYRQNIFQRFVQVDSSDTREKGGTGLGLSIAKTIVDHHGGFINYESQMGIGTQFYFDLPVRDPPKMTSSDANNEAGSGDDIVCGNNSNPVVSNQLEAPHVLHSKGIYLIYALLITSSVSNMMLQNTANHTLKNSVNKATIYA